MPGIYVDELSTLDMSKNPMGKYSKAEKYLAYNEKGEIVGRGRNRREEARSALAHAEIEAIREACAAVGDWRLADCGLYVTLEPCPMGAGAILNARLKWICYGARDEKTGSCGSVLNLFEENYGYRPAVYGGVLEAECLARMQEFFRRLRR